MENFSLGVKSINCVIESAANAYGFGIFTYDPETGLIQTMKSCDSNIFLKTIIRQIPSSKNNLRFIDVVIKIDQNDTNNKGCTPEDLSQAKECVEVINDQGFLYI